MTSVLQDIYQWQVDSGNASRVYVDFTESAFQIEEALEGFESLQVLVDHLGTSTATPKQVSRDIVSLACSGDEVISDVDRLDKACDAIVFAVGSIAKLNLTYDQLVEALTIVNTANQAKLGCSRDEHGKLSKPADFPNPEPKLEALLRNRNRP